MIICSLPHLDTPTGKRHAESALKIKGLVVENIQQHYTDNKVHARKGNIPNMVHEKNIHLIGCEVMRFINNMYTYKRTHPTHKYKPNQVVSIKLT